MNYIVTNQILVMDIMPEYIYSVCFIQSLFCLRFLVFHYQKIYFHLIGHFREMDLKHWDDIIDEVELDNVGVGETE